MPTGADPGPFTGEGDKQAMNAFCKDHLWKDGAPSPAHCMVIALASCKVYPGITSKQRLKDVDSACGVLA